MGAFRRESPSKRPCGCSPFGRGGRLAIVALVHGLASEKLSSTPPSGARLEDPGGRLKKAALGRGACRALESGISLMHDVNYPEARTRCREAPRWGAASTDRL